MGVAGKGTHNINHRQFFDIPLFLRQGPALMKRVEE